MLGLCVMHVSSLSSILSTMYIYLCVSCLLLYMCILSIFYVIYSIPLSFLTMNTNRTDVRIDLEVIPTGSATKMQAKLNQWITKGELVKYEIHVLADDKLLFNICRKKTAGE